MATGNTNLYRVPFLSALAVLFKPRGFIASRILTPITIGATDFDYPAWKKDGWFRVPHTKIAPSSDIPLVTVDAEVKRGHLDDHALGSYVDERQIRQGGGGLPTLALFMQRQKLGLMLEEESSIAATLRDTSVLTLNETLNGAAQWSDPSSDPQADVRRWRRSLIQRANFGACSREVADAILGHPKFLDRFKYTTPPQDDAADEKMLAAFFGLSEFYIADGLVENAEVGQTESLTRIWGKDFVLGYHTPEAPNPLMDQPTCGWLVRYGSAVGDNQTKAGGADEESYRVYVEPPRPSRGTGAGATFSKTETNYAALVSAPELMFLGKNVIA